MTTIGHGNQDFSYDKKKVSTNVNQQIETIKKEGKKVAGSADEVAAFQKLSEELAANGANKHEQNLVKGLIVEYQTKAEQENSQALQKKQKAEITPAAREAVKNIKKMIPDKKELDEPEARMLLDLIKNTRGDYNAADIEYFKQELMKAGFGDLLTNDGFGAETKPDKTTKEEKNINPPEPQEREAVAEPHGAVDGPHTEDKPAKPQKEDVPHEPSEKEIPHFPKMPKKVSGKKPVSYFPKPEKPVTSTPKKPVTKTPSETTSDPKTRITDTRKTRGQYLARQLDKEINGKAITNNNRVNNLLKQVNKETAYSFLVEYTHIDGDRQLDVNRDVYGVSDVFNQIDSTSAKHLVNVTIQQAKDMGLEKTKAYAQLSNLYRSMNNTLNDKSDPDPALQRRLDIALVAMMNQMTKVVQ